MRDKGANAVYRWAHEVRRKSEQYGGRLSRGGRTVATAARPTCSSIAELCQRVSFFAAPQRHVYVELRPPAAILLVHMSMRPISVKGMGRRTVTRALSLLLFWASSQNCKKELKRKPHLNCFFSQYCRRVTTCANVSYAIADVLDTSAVSDTSAIAYGR